MRAAVIEAPGRPRLWEVRRGDCIDELAAIEDESVRLIFADPL